MNPRRIAIVGDEKIVKQVLEQMESERRHDIEMSKQHHFDFYIPNEEHYSYYVDQAEAILICADGSESPTGTLDYRVNKHNKENAAIPLLFYCANYPQVNRDDFKTNLDKAIKSAKEKNLIGVFKDQLSFQEMADAIDNRKKLASEERINEDARIDSAFNRPTIIRQNISNPGVIGNFIAGLRRNPVRAAFVTVGAAIGLTIGLALTFTGVFAAIGLPLTALSVAAIVVGGAALGYGANKAITAHRHTTVLITLDAKQVERFTSSTGRYGFGLDNQSDFKIVSDEPTPPPSYTSPFKLTGMDPTVSKTVPTDGEQTKDANLKPNPNDTKPQ